MSFWRALLKKPNGIDDLSEMREQFSDSGKRVVEAAKKLARSAETVSRHQGEMELARLQFRARKSGAH